MLEHKLHIDTGTSELLCFVQERVAVVTMNRPEARNALSDQLTPALRRMVRRCADDPGIGVLMITGTGGAFCAGGDIKGMGGSSGESIDERVASLRLKQRTLTGALVGLRKPTIAALPGPAAGAGLAIALACDIRIAAQSAFVTTAYVRIGFSGDYGIGWLLTRAVGSARARELMFFSDRINATKCERIGLVNRVCPDKLLQQEAFEAARQLANGPKMALRFIKDNLDDATTLDFLTAMDREAERMIAAGQTPDHKEAVRAFVEKRDPRFG